MGLTVNTNTSALFAAGRLQETDSSLTASLERIATGRRINKAADDSSGMTIADNLTSQSRGMGQMIRNANDSISMMQIAEGALGEAAGIMQDIRSKALQAASDSQTTETRRALQADIDKSLGALTDIYSDTSFNDQKLLKEAPGLSDLSDIDVLSQEGAQAAIEAADSAIENVSAARSGLGSEQNRLSSEIANLTVARMNGMASESQIRDVDLAEESMNMTKINNLRQAGIFALTQANARSENVLQLLK